MDGNTGEAGDQDVVDSLVVEDLVRREDKAVLERGHDLLDMAVVERQDTVQNGDLIIAERLLALAVELEEALELGLLVATKSVGTIRTTHV